MRRVSKEKADAVRFFLPADVLPALEGLPWQHSLERWDLRRVPFREVKSGLSRHVVRFVEAGSHCYAVKQTSESGARSELQRYRDLIRLGIPTLSPVGIVVRDDGRTPVQTSIGTQHQARRTGFLITELMEKVLPDSYLFRRGFSRENRNRIWDAVIRLFAQLHSNGVYWGDASLANMLIKFSTQELPEVGHRTRLEAILADAETVEIRASVSDSLRMADVEFFLESMFWNDADLRSSGLVRDPLVTKVDQDYVIDKYQEAYGLELEVRSFELVTHIDVDRLLGSFNVKGHGKLLLKHIDEHKWYLSERQGREVDLEAAAYDWYANVFRPVCRVFNEFGLPAHFPERTASSLYVEIMEHKYFMSKQVHRDVGLVTALRDYAARFAPQEPVTSVVREIIGALTALLRGEAPANRNIYLS